MIWNRHGKCSTALGTECLITEVLAVEMENRPGALARVLETLAEEHINVEYAYVAPGATSGKTLGIFHTSNPKRRREDPDRRDEYQRTRRFRSPAAAFTVGNGTYGR